MFIKDERLSDPEKYIHFSPVSDAQFDLYCYSGTSYWLVVHNDGSTRENQHRMQLRPEYPSLLPGIMIQCWDGIAILLYLE